MTIDTDVMSELSNLAGPDTSISQPVPSDTETPGTGTDTTAEASTATPEDADKPRYTTIAGTFATAEDAASAGFTDLLTVAEFANELTVRNLTTKGMGADGIVDKSTVYVAMRAVRNPLPVVLVDDTAYLQRSSMTDWDNRPVRGEGTSASGSASTMTNDKLLRVSADARDKRDALQRRLESLQARLAAAEKLVAKRGTQLTARGLSWDAVDAAASDAETTIPDNGDETSDNGNDTDTSTTNE
jgi:hypothetical protein